MIKLYPFQEVGVKFLVSRRSSCLADGMGLGKTIQALMAIKSLGSSRVLIACPQGVKFQWEAKAKELLKGYVVRCVKSSRFVVTKNPIAKEITIVSVDSCWREPLFTQLKSITWDVIICDEAHSLKNIKSNRGRAILGKKGLVLNSVRHWMLTGTPVLNRPVDLFPMLRTLAPELLGEYKGYMAYTERYCAGYNDGFGWNDKGASNLEELAERISPFFLRRTLREVMDCLPPITISSIMIEPDKALQAALKKEKEYLKKIKEFALGEVSSIRREVGIMKLPASIEFIEQTLEKVDKLVVFAYHTDVMKSLNATFKDSVVYSGMQSEAQKRQAKERFIKDPSCRLFIGQIKAAGQGLDGLQTVCHTCVFAEMTYTPAELDQAVARIERLGQSQPMSAYFIVAEGSHDEDMVVMIERKRKVISTLMDVEDSSIINSIFDI